MGFGFEIDGSPCFTFEGKMGDEDVVVRVRTDPFEDAEVRATIEDGAIREKQEPDEE